MSEQPSLFSEADSLDAAKAARQMVEGPAEDVAAGQPSETPEVALAAGNTALEEVDLDSASSSQPPKRVLDLRNRGQSAFHRRASASRRSKPRIIRAEASTADISEETEEEEVPQSPRAALPDNVRDLIDEHRERGKSDRMEKFASLQRNRYFKSDES